MTNERHPRARRWARLLLAAAMVSLAAHYVVYTFPLEKVRIVYDRY